MGYPFILLDIIRKGFQIYFNPLQKFHIIKYMGLLLLFLTNLIFPLAGIGVILGFLFSSRRGLLKHLIPEMRERFGLEEPGTLIEQAVWLHCASVGEVRSIAQIIPALKELYNRDILVTTTTQAGKETALKNKQISQVVLVPLDFYPSCRRFIRLANPYRLFLVEREIWPNLLEAAHRAGVPAAVINGRISKKSVRSYLLVKPLFKRVLNYLRFAALQTPEDRHSYLKLGVASEKLLVCGNIKYDTLNEAPAQLDRVDKILTALGWNTHPILVMGSTHPREETMMLRAMPDFIKQNLKVIFAPRHLERLPEICETLRQSGLAHAFVSDNNFPKSADILCADVMGLLPALYARATLTFVGGSVVARGAHNLLEPAILAKTVLFGEHFYNTAQPALALLESGGGVLVNEYDFKTIVCRLLADPVQLSNMADKARQTALTFKGATQKILDGIQTYERTTT